MIELYHGTTTSAGHSIEKVGIDVDYSTKELLDFSKGFYTTPNPSFALRTAKNRFRTRKLFSKLYQREAGIVIVALEYSDILGDSLSIKKFVEPSNRWARFIAANRVEAGEEI